jgi:hypothetical protein
MLTRALYRKNIRQWEQWSRVAAGVAMAVAAIGVASLLGRVLLLGGGAFMIVTGFVGWCPACAMIGRSVEDPDHVPR